MKNNINSFLNYDNLIEILKEQTIKHNDSLICQYTVLNDDTYITLAVDTNIPKIGEEDYEEEDAPIMVIYYGDIYYTSSLSEKNYNLAIKLIYDLIDNQIKKKISYNYYESLEENNETINTIKIH